MARLEEATLFRPDPKLSYPGGLGGGGNGGGGDDDDGPSIAVSARLAEAARSTQRRKGLSFVVTLICAALTVLGVVFAPRTYEADSRVLVQRTATGGPPAFVSPEEMRNVAREYEEQVMARDNILAIVEQKNLVARYDEMRQPHRRLLDDIRRKLGQPAPSDEEKRDALVSNIEQRLKVSVDATTVTFKIEWSEPESARDIVDAATKSFFAARFQSEVGVIPARLERHKGFVAQAHKELESAAADLVHLQKAKTVQDAQVRFDTATATYQTLAKQLQELEVQLQEQQALYKSRYVITHPAGIPAGPTRSVALIAMAVGIVATIAAVLLAAALADRRSGMFFEPRDVRDRIGLPVFAMFALESER